MLYRMRSASRTQQIYDHSYNDKKSLKYQEIGGVLIATILQCMQSERERGVGGEGIRARAKYDEGRMEGRPFDVKVGFSPMNGWQCGTATRIQSEAPSIDR